MNQKFEHRTALKNPGQMVSKYNPYVVLGKNRENPFTSGRNKGVQTTLTGGTERTLRPTMWWKE